MQILSIFESLSSKSHFDATLRTEFLAPKYLIIFVLNVVCPQSRMSSKSSVLKVASSKLCPQRRTSSLSHSHIPFLRNTIGLGNIMQFFHYTYSFLEKYSLSKTVSKHVGNVNTAHCFSSGEDLHKVLSAQRRKVNFDSALFEHMVVFKCGAIEDLMVGNQ